MRSNGLLVTLSSDPLLADAALEALRSHPAIEAGEREELWLPVVTSTPDTKASHEVHEWIEALEGVTLVDVVFAGFNDPAPTSPPVNTQHTQPL